MKFVRFAGRDNAPRLGVVDGDAYHVVAGHTDLLPLLESGVDALLEAGGAAIERGETVDPATVVNLSPIATPPTFRDFYAFEQHVRAGRKWRGLEMDPLWYEIPVFYFSNPYAFRGEGDVRMTPGSTAFDFELEVAAVLGKGGSDLTAEEGEDAVAGYAILNDWSGRDVQRREMTLSMGPVKGKDTATSLGPWFVTKDELEPHRTATGFDRTMTCTVNGVEYSRANWSDVHFSFGEMVSYASRGTEVRPGDVIGSGTCGTGCINELSQAHGAGRFPFLQPGDEVVAAIEGLGSLRSTIVASPDPIPFR
ncbi:fumarylacetoacetate hydrolase family protein [Amycolatopsis thermophila]|uniref:2-keto-4-pentenoate hydratase/2-oxohepta-3-ene-1,7-dioic acid hydratase in catechol pathway n=1 Tax=Amycolatopsis thermophila TaxID=206084 RepID=A0ABU0EYB9_9PSEU|nr:fumarylacetoacetate hydrolase family protein [Amycolatopsis thermophila]MDQ0380309.1 2-keto-4-pentenoate hydratase/2-oxohepta-3-ene-1,7-dioic acid hydratase in catechol pathway [Amycolatopsis thermophila]